MMRKEMAVNARDGAERTVTCGGSDAAERDDAFAGDPEVVVREEAAPFAAQTLQQRERERERRLSFQHRFDSAEREGRKIHPSLSGIPRTLEKGAR